MIEYTTPEPGALATIAVKVDTNDPIAKQLFDKLIAQCKSLKNREIKYLALKRKYALIAEGYNNEIIADPTNRTEALEQKFLSALYKSDYYDMKAQELNRRVAAILQPMRKYQTNGTILISKRT